MERHGIGREGLSVTCDWEMADERPNRVGRIEDPPGAAREGFPADDHARLMAVVEHCTVHNSLVRMPEVRIMAETAPAAA